MFTIHDDTLTLSIASLQGAELDPTTQANGAINGEGGGSSASPTLTKQARMVKVKKIVGILLVKQVSSRNTPLISNNLTLP